MFGYIKRKFGVVTAEEKNGWVYVEGVNASFMDKDFQRMWKTSKIGMHMFSKVTRNGFVLPSFFALELRYMLEKLLSTGKQMLVSRRTARQIVDQLNENTWLASTLDESKRCLNLDNLKKFHWKPLDHQLNFLHHYDKLVPQFGLKGMILSAAPGSGKTALGLFLSECLESDYTIIVSPKLALDKVWRQTLATIFKTPTTFWVSTDPAGYSGQKYLVVHYEYLEKLMKFVGKLSGKITIILDESHNLNEISSLRTQLFIDLCKKTKTENVIWASGTSFKAQGSESIPIFSTIEPRFTKEVGERFKKLYGTGGGRSLDILAHRVDVMSFKVAKSELKLEAPRIIDVPVKVPNGDDFTLDKVKLEMRAFVEERSKYYASRKSLDQDFFDACLLKAYKTFKRPIEFEEYERYLHCIKVVQQNVGDLSVCKDELMFCNRYEREVIMPKLDNAEAKQFKDVKSIIKYVSLKIQGECLGRILGKRRMECIKAVSQHIDYGKIIESTEKKTVIFTSYVEVLESTSHKVADLGYSPMVVYGKTNTELASIVTAFETKKEINPLIATYQSLSTAVPLTVADCMIMVNAPFRDYIHQQAISRIHRIGANTQVNVYIAKLDTDTAPNLSSRSLDILAWSQTQVELITRTKSPFPVSETAGVSLESEDNQGNNDGNDFIGISFEGLDIHEAFEDITEVSGVEPITVSTPAVPKLDMHMTLFNWN